MEAIKIIEPRVNIKADTEKNHMVVLGGLRYTEQVHTADSYSQNQALFNFQPPSYDTIVDRNIKIRCKLNIVATGGDFQIGTNDGPRQFPIAAITDVLDLAINGEHVSTSLGDYIHALLCYDNNSQDRLKWSESSAMPDQYQVLSDWTTFGSNRNPLADYGENSNEQTRGGFVPYVVNAGNNVTYEFTEPLFISPMLNGLTEDEGLSNVNQLAITFRWKSDLSLVWSHSSAGNPITSLAVTFVEPPSLLVTYITRDVLQQIPPVITYPYHKPQEYIKTVNGGLAVPAGSTNQRVISDSIKLNQVPRKMFLFLRRSRQTSNFLTADSFATITNVTLNWDNQSGLLSNAQQQDLYKISRRNGLNLTWNQWKTYRGSVFCCEFGTDIGLQDGLAPGTQGQFTFYVQVDFENNSSQNIIYEFYTILILEGLYMVSPNQGRATLGNLVPQDILNSKSSPEFNFNDAQSHLAGGGFLSKMKNIIHKTAKGISKGVSVANKIVPYAQGIPGVSSAMPYLSMLDKGSKSLARMTGGGPVGGSLMSGRKINRRQMRR
jgi:hypothetical protein